MNSSCEDFSRFKEQCRQDGLASRAQLSQDLWVLYQLGLDAARQGGYFVEFGAYDGIESSNTLLLEQSFGWHGALAEPCPSVTLKLAANRPGCSLSFSCIAGDKSRREFVECGGGSTIKGYESLDYNAPARAGASTSWLDTITLNDFLRQVSAPSLIDYMSIDTEGSELEILEAFDFAYDIRLLTVEHNYVEPKKQQTRELLAARGFDFVDGAGWPDVTLFDDWFVRRRQDNGPQPALSRSRDRRPLQPALCPLHAPLSLHG